MTIYRVYRNYPFNVKIIKDRYCDATVNKSISTDAAETVTLTPYDGLESQVNNNATAPLLFISEGMLPDNSLAGAAQGCLMPEGSEYLISSQGYYNVPCSGGLKVNYETGVAEGFSAENKIDLGRCLEVDNYAVIQKVYFDGETRAQTIWLADGSKCVGVNGGKLGVYMTDWTLSENVLTSGIYWVKATYSDRSFKLYTLADDSETYTLDTLPALESWVEELTVEDCDSPLASSSTLRLSSNSEAFWGGKMYLDGARVFYGDEYFMMLFRTNKTEIFQGMLASGVSCDGQAQNYNIFYKNGKFVADTAEAKSGYRWCGSTSIKSFVPSSVYKKCYTENGTLNLSYPNLSGFSNMNYALTDKALPMGQFFAVNIKIISKVTVTSSNYTQNILWDNSANNHGIGVATYKWRIWNGTAVTGGSAVNGTTYWIQVVQQNEQGTKLYVLDDDGTYTFETLPDIEQWTLAVSVNSALFDTSGQKLRIGTGYTTPTEYWHGKIDLSNTCIYTKVQGGADTGWTVYWKPFAAVSV